MSKSKFYRRPKRDPIKNFFLLPNELFHLDLSGGAKLVYAYLLYCEDRETYQCYPSYKKIGRNTNMSINTVKKYVTELEDKGLITTERRTRVTPDGQIQNSTLLYTIRPIQEAMELYYERQMTKLNQATALEYARQRAARALWYHTASGL